MAKEPETKSLPPCPVCGRPAAAAHRPFCSARCQEVDLGRWLSGVYRIPGPPAELDEDPPPSPDAA
ncbi:DNA gyrase inhibitor YacG [Rhodopila globiformis]|uniref:DNA gyrase inhibitor YacG n=1 Tax=Rhodopila globiformis TaxID=1071 RepID=A0A2S6NK34_RHOGL|nr:DNA gyrase inhibitor YacG [Rhodopila globiformis]PPQ35301.1 DNA gyrase inhibitor YacG [Rhodopila globiformis]